MSAAPIPRVGLRAFLDANDAERRAIAGGVDDICRSTGFLIVDDHGVPDGVIGGAWRAARRFFELPIEKKLAARSPEPGNPRGYFPCESETLARSRDVDTPPDIKESFSSGPLSIPDGLEGVDDFFYGANIWPEEPAEFKDAWIDYYRAMERLGAEIMRLFAAALDLDFTYFDAMHTHHLSALRALSYPPQTAAPLPGQRPAGEHSDYGSVTILKPDPDVAGLEIRLPSGEWQAAPLIQDGFLVNIGDMLARWTNDRWVSTMHRVASPGTARRRQSIAYFQNPNYDAEIRCLKTCLEPGERPQYATVLAGPYLRQKFGATL